MTPPSTYSKGLEPFLYGILCTGNESRNKDTCVDKNDRVRCLIHKSVPTKSLPFPLSSTYGTRLSYASLSHEIAYAAAWKKAVEYDCVPGWAGEEMNLRHMQGPPSVFKNHAEEFCSTA